MENAGWLKIATLLSALLLSVHLADDIVRGFEKGALPNLLVVPILVLWLGGAVGLAERRAGYVVTLLGSLLGAFVPVVHFAATGGVAGGGLASSAGALFFVWTLLALGVASLSGVLLSASGLWRSFARPTES